MSDSPGSKSEEGKEAVYAVPENGAEVVDKGIVNQAAPLAKKLKGRHMQMIAIGMRPRF